MHMPLTLHHVNLVLTVHTFYDRFNHNMLSTYVWGGARASCHESTTHTHLFLAQTVVPLAVMCQRGRASKSEDGPANAAGVLDVLFEGARSAIAATSNHRQ